MFLQLCRALSSLCLCLSSRSRRLSAPLSLAPPPATGGAPPLSPTPSQAHSSLFSLSLSRALCALCHCECRLPLTPPRLYLRHAASGCSRRPVRPLRHNRSSRRTSSPPPQLSASLSLSQLTRCTEVKMAENSSKELLELEAKTGSVSSASNIESKLFVCKKDVPFTVSDGSLQKPTMSPLPKSQFLGKVKDFLGVLSESNKKLMEDAKERPDSYDIEVIGGDESKYIEMDLMLGIADLHTPEAVAAAESAMAGYQPPVRMAESSSGSEDEDSSDDEDDAEEDGNHDQDAEAGSESVKLGLKVGDSSCQESKKQKPKKRPKIVELA